MAGDAEASWMGAALSITEQEIGLGLKLAESFEQCRNLSER